MKITSLLVPYIRLVQPMLDRYCAGCHAKNANRAPSLAGKPDDQPWTPAYRNL